MRTYNFDYIQGSSKPVGTIEAKDDTDFYAQLPAYLKEHGGTMVRGSVRFSEQGKVADPPISQPRPEYLLHAKKMADPSKPFVY